MQSFDELSGIDGSTLKYGKYMDAACNIKPLIAQIAPLSFQGSHRTHTQTSEVSWAARFSGHWVVTSMFA